MTTPRKLQRDVYTETVTTQAGEQSAARLPALTLTDVCTGYNGADAIKDLTLTFYKGERVAVVGPNGAGKSTLFKALVGLLPLSNGTITLGADHNQALKARQRAIGYLQQHVDVDWQFPANVFDTVMMGRLRHIGWLHWPTKRDKEEVMKALTFVGMDKYHRRQISELSGGQQRRILIARALAQEASILLLDEPFSGVDTPTTDGLFELLDNLRAENITVLIAIHDLNLARTHFDRVLLLNTQAIAYAPPATSLVPQAIGEAYGVPIHNGPSTEHVFYLSNNDCCE